MALTKYKLGQLIEQRREKYDGKEALDSWGVCRDGFIPPKIDDADTSIYNVFYLNDFVFNPARMELNSIALNTSFKKAICSSLYEIFYIKRTDLVLPEYLNIFIKRNEFARKCWYEAIGSARNYFRVSNLSEFDIELPPLSIQQKYVEVYNSILENQKNYERGLEDLKLVCDGYLEKLATENEKVKIGSFIEQVDERNEHGEFKIENLRGISIEKKFISTKANMKGVSLKPYLLVKPNYFSYVPVTSRNGEKITLALNSTNTTYIVSSSYTVFRIINESKLCPKYLMMFFNRSEFDRYARFNSWGSARESFDWSEMCNVTIPIPPIEIQKSIVAIYNARNERIAINEKLKSQIKDICPILIKGSLEEAKEKNN